MTETASSGTTGNELSQELNDISERLVTARANGEALPGFPGTLPDNLQDAYAIQTASIARWPDKIVGWKVGMVPPEFRPALGAKRLSGPIFASSVVTVDSGSATTMPIFDGGFAAVEAEFVLRLGTTVQPTSKEFSDEELIDLVGALHVGAEIASSPMAVINKLGPVCVVSDFGNNAGLLLGPSVPNWSSLPSDALTATVSVDDVVVGAATAGAIEGGLLQPLRFLVRLCAERGLVLNEGTLISSGAVTGIHDVEVNSKAHVDFGTFGAFNVAFEAKQAGQ